ncbi:MAG: hypothetical protein JWO31_143 [Phycisphaerales bacterium]|nr:hypothetical protein [Phycisphaerales bacterium]
MAETTKHERVDEHAGEDGTIGAGGGGTNDVTSGGGAGAGIPDAETALTVGDAVIGGDVAADKAKLFPEASGVKGDRPPGHAIPPPKGG